MIGIKFLFDLMAAKIAQIDSDFDWLNSTHSSHSDMDLSFPIPVIGKVAIDPFLTVKINFKAR